MAGVKIGVIEDTSTNALQKLLAAAGDLKPALKNIGEYEAQSTKERIAKGVTPAGAKFAPLNPEYAKTKKGPSILIGETRDLSSIVYQLAGDEGVEVGTSAKHGAIHQFGGTITPKNGAALVFAMGGRTITVSSVTIPARPFLGISEEDKQEIAAILADHFELAGGGAAE